MTSRAVAMPALTVSADRVTYTEPGRLILADVTLVAAPRQLFTIDAPSGAGSSLVLSILAGLTLPSSGVVRYGHAPIDHGWRSLRAVVEQDHPLAAELTAAETVSLPLRAAGLRRKHLMMRTGRWLEALGLAAASEQLVSELSGGQQQRIAIARALAAETPVLLLDDPTAELDAGNRATVISLIRERLASGAVVGAATHDPELVAVSDRLFTIADGQLRVAPDRDPPL